MGAAMEPDTSIVVGVLLGAVSILILCAIAAMRWWDNGED